MKRLPARVSYMIDYDGSHYQIHADGRIYLKAPYTGQLRYACLHESELGQDILAEYWRQQRWYFRAWRWVVDWFGKIKLK